MAVQPALADIDFGDSVHARAQRAWNFFVLGFDLRFDAHHVAAVGILSTAADLLHHNWHSHMRHAGEGESALLTDLYAGHITLIDL